MSLSAEATEKDASAVAKTLDFGWLDRFAGRRFQFHHLVPITKEDASYSDGGRPVWRQGTKLLSAALVMHVPAHS